MTQLDDVQAFANANFPLRAITRLSSAVAFTGDPNGGGAPAILQNATPGTKFLDELSGVEWRKIASGATSWVETSPSAVTLGAMTVTIDPFTGTPAPNPPAGFIFTNQDGVDAYLTSQSATAFEFLDGFWEHLPSSIQNPIDITFPSGIIRPGPEASPFSFNFADKKFLAGASLDVRGDTNTANWDVIDAGGTIQAHQVASLDPFIDMTAASLPSDRSLTGYYAVFSNGYVGLIHEHTDTRIHLTSDLAPAPVNGVTTMSVRAPSTILRNSTDDIVPVNANTFASDQTDTVGNTFTALRIQGWGDNTGNTVRIGGGGTTYLHFLIDKRDQAVLGQGNVGSIEGAGAFFCHCSIIGDSFPEVTGIDANLVIQGVGSTAFMINSFFQGGEDGFGPLFGAQLFLWACVVEGTGKTVAGITGVVETFGAGVVLNIQEVTFFGPGVRTTIRGTDPALSGIFLTTGAVLVSFGQFGLRLDNVANFGIEMGERVTADISGTPAGGGIESNGPGTVSVKLNGPFVAFGADANSTFDIVEDADAVQRTFATVIATPASDSQFNLMK